MGLDLKNGEHQIVLKYTPPKMNLGIILSIFGIIMFLGSIIISKKSKK